MPTVQQLPAATTVNLTDDIMLDQNGTSVNATVAQVLDAMPLGAGLVRSGDTVAADTTVLAPLAGPTLTGTPSAPTPPVGDNSTRLATTAFVMANTGTAVPTGTLTLTGDVTGTGSGTIATTLASVGTAGIFERVTVDAKGRVTAGATLGAADITSALGFTPIAANETITLAGDLSGSGTTSITATLPVVVNPGAYAKVTVDAKGRVTAGGPLGTADISAALGYVPIGANETITLSGDITGSGTTTITATLPAVVTPGAYAKVTVDAKGRVTAGGTLAASDLASVDLSAADATASGGTTARTLAARAHDVINVLDYGADPTGGSDSAVAFSTAMNAVASGTWGRVFVPRGTYQLGSVVNQPAGRSIAVIFDDGANIAGAGYLGVDRVESTQGPFALRQNSGGFFGFAPSVDSAANPGFATDLIFNTPQNSQSMRVGWDRRYTNTNVYGKVHTGIDIAEQQVHSWPNLYDNSSGWGLWEVINGPTIDEDSAARAGLSASAELCEIDIVNNQAEAGWTWQSGQGNTVQGMSIDPWGQNGLYGGSILYTYGTVGSYDGNVGGLNSRWFSYPAVFSAGNPPAVQAGSTIVVNGTTITLSAGESLSAIAAAINAAGIANVRAAATTWGGVVSRLVIFGTQASDLGTLTLSGTALPLLGIASGTYTTPRGEYAVAVGDAGSVAVGDRLVANGVTVTVGGGGAASDVAAAINAAGIPGIAADTNANGVIVITCFVALQPGGLVLADASGYTTLEKIALRPGTFLPPTPPKGFATAYSDLTTPICQPTDQITITATDINGTVHGPVTVTLNGGAGTGWPQDVAASIQGQLIAAGFYSANFTALSSGSAVVAARAVGGGLNQGVQIRNTAGGTLMLANAHGVPLDTLGIAPGTYQPGGTSAGSQTVFMAAEDSIATGGRGVFIGGVSNATDLTVYPHTPLETRGGFLHGLRLDRASFADGNAIIVAPTHAIAWGSAAQGQHLLTVASGTLQFDGQPIVSSAAFDAAFGTEVGDLLVRTASGWAALTPGAQGAMLTANGPGTALAWTQPVPVAAAGAVLATSGTAGVAGTITPSAILDGLGSTFGDMLYRGASGWLALAPGATGQVLQSGGPGANPAWTTSQWNAGTVAALGSNLALSAGTLTLAGTLTGETLAAPTLTGTVKNSGTISGGTLQPAAIAGGALSGTITNLDTIAGGVIDLSAGALRVAASNTATGLIGNTGTLTTPQQVAIGTGLTLSAGTLATAPLTTVFTSNGTWTPRATSTFARILLVGGGGAGGGGAQTASGTAASGGGGGGGGGVFAWEGPIATLTGASGGLAVTVGAGGTAGSAAASAGTAGGNGGAGATTTLANVGMAGGGGGGAGGQIGGACGGGGGGMGAAPLSGMTVTGGTGSGATAGLGAITINGMGGFGNGGSGNFGGIIYFLANAGSGGGGSAATGAANGGGGAVNTPSGGGSGGGVTTAPASNNGSVGGWVALYAASHGGGGTSATPNGGAAAMALLNKPGGGGGGGLGNASGAGGAGGTGMNGGGGGGGGSCLNASTPGAGGTGGGGLAVVEEW